MRTQEVGYTARTYEDRDEDAVLRLLAASLDRGPTGARTAGFFRWKHLENPFGRSLMLVADAGGDIVGLRAFMRWEFIAGGERLRAVRAVDTATHPSFQGRGIFTRLTMDAIELLRADTHFIFNTPNEKSLPGYLKMGWRTVDAVPVHVRPRPLRMATRLAGLRRSSHRAGGDDASDELTSYSGALPGADGRIETIRSAEYLSWRYAATPSLGYRTVRAGDACAIYRVRPRGRLVEATVAEVFADNAGAARRVLRAVARAAGADHVAAHLAAGTPARAASRSALFFRAPRSVTLVARPLQPELIRDPLVFANWCLSAGDLEVF